MELVTLILVNAEDAGGLAVEIQFEASIIQRNRDTGIEVNETGERGIGQRDFDSGSDGIVIEREKNPILRPLVQNGAAEIAGLQIDTMPSLGLHVFSGIPIDP